MIVTTGKHIKIQSGGFHFERTAETPGLVTVRDREGNKIGLPGNNEDGERFIKAYLRIVSEDIKYRESECE